MLIMNSNINTFELTDSSSDDDELMSAFDDSELKKTKIEDAENKYFYTQPNRDYDTEKRIRDRMAIITSFLCDIDNIDDTYKYFLCRKMTVSEFIREFDLMKLKKQTFENMKKEYIEIKKKFNNIDFNKVIEFSNKPCHKRTKREDKYINNYYRTKFIIHQYEYYDDYIMEGMIGFTKITF